MLKILFLSYGHSPFKYHTGAHQRTNLLCAALSKIARVDVLTLDDDKESTISNCSLLKIDNYVSSKDAKHLRREPVRYPLFLKVFVKFFSLFKETTVGVLGSKKKCLAKLAASLEKEKKYDYIFAKNINSMMVFGIKPRKNVILDNDDLPEQFFQSKFDFLKNSRSLRSYYLKLKFFISARTSRCFTGKIVEKTAAAFLANEAQCALFANAVYLPNIPHPINAAPAVSVESAERTGAARHHIMFVGFIDYEPNLWGVEHFLDNIYPEVLRNIPDAHFKIIGKISEEKKNKWLEMYKNISVMGIVDDLQTEYRNSSVVVVPVYSGAGTNIKVLEAMAMGKALVISAFAGRGFEKLLVNGKNIFIADSDRDFAEKILLLFESKERGESLGKAARESINTYYSFEHFADIIYRSLNVFPDDK